MILEPSPDGDRPPPPTVLLLARSATTAGPLREMARLRDHAAALPGIGKAVFAFAEEGAPSLRSVLHELIGHEPIGADRAPLVIVPILLPAEATFETWLRRVLQRWQAADERRWPDIRIAPFLAEQPLMRDLLAAVIRSEDARPVEKPQEAGAAEGSVVPAPKRRVLVCAGAPCNMAGAAVIWGHLRGEQKRLSLRTAGDGTMSAKTSCLGPCSLAPVLQVWPEGTYYGGVDEAGVDRIIQRHLLGGEIVEDLAYRPTGAKQKLRT